MSPSVSENSPMLRSRYSNTPNAAPDTAKEKYVPMYDVDSERAKQTKGNKFTGWLENIDVTQTFNRAFTSVKPEAKQETYSYGTTSFHEKFLKEEEQFDNEMFVPLHFDIGIPGFQDAIRKVDHQRENAERKCAILHLSTHTYRKKYDQMEKVLIKSLKTALKQYVEKMESKSQE